MLAYLQRWADPGALSQIVGALIGASIAICLWYAERRRTERERKETEIAQSKRFRATLKSAIKRLKREIESFILQCNATRIEVMAKSQGEPDEVLSNSDSVKRLLDRFPINLPNSFEFSEMHVSALNEDALEALSDIKDALQEMFIERRALQELAQVNDLIAIPDSLAEVHEYASRAIGPMDRLEGFLDRALV